MARTVIAMTAMPPSIDRAAFECYSAWDGSNVFEIYWAVEGTGGVEDEDEKKWLEWEMHPFRWLLHNQTVGSVGVDTGSV
jgi:hypothetical protein